MSEHGTKIEWTHPPGYRGETWNPVRGCRRVSRGCQNCYAERVAHRFRGNGQPYQGLTTADGRWTGEVRLVPDVLDAPLRWRNPRCVFVNSMGDLFHEHVEDHFIEQVFGVMAACQRHRFIVLTKRADRMEELLSTRWFTENVGDQAWVRIGRRGAEAYSDCYTWPLRNVILGVSVEDQPTADDRIPLLAITPAACRMISYEPALDSVDFGEYLHETDWLVIGGESGPGARPFDVVWAEDAIRQCYKAGVQCFTKQLGSAPMLGDLSHQHGWPAYGDAVDWETGRIYLRDRKGGDPDEWPADLRVREWPAIMSPV